MTGTRSTAIFWRRATKRGAEDTDASDKKIRSTIALAAIKTVRADYDAMIACRPLPPHLSSPRPRPGLRHGTRLVGRRIPSLWPEVARAFMGAKSANVESVLGSLSAIGAIVAFDVDDECRYRASGRVTAGPRP